MEIPRIIESLREDNSRKGKEAILLSNKNNELLKNIFFYTYNPLLTYYIRTIPHYTHSTKCMSLKEAITLLPEFYNRVVTGNAAIDRLADILSRLHKDNAKIFECIIARDLRCGVSESTINKIWKDLVPSYPCLLASPDNPKTRAKIKFPAIAQEKCDGMRVNVIVSCGRVEFKSRNGMLIDCANPQLIYEFLSFSKSLGYDTVFDGELLVMSTTKEPLPRKIGNGICNKAIKGTISDVERNLFSICIWDAIPYENFLTGSCKTPYKDRLAAYKAAYSPNFTKISLVPSWEVLSWNQAELIYCRVVSQGKEGLVIKNQSGIWADKRSGDLVKMKESHVCELLVTKWVEGTGKFEGLMGALECESSGKNPIRVSVGTGFSDEERRNITPKNIVGKIISVIYNEVITSEDGTRSLFLPRFDEIREDKTEADEIA